MTARIYTAAGAEAIVSACRAQRETWRQIAESDPTFRVDAEYRARIDREEGLATSVAFHAQRAERAEADLTEATDRARDAEAECAAAEAALVAVWQAITNDDLPRLPTGDGTVVDAEAVGRRLAAVVTERDALNNLVSCQRDTIDELNRELDALRAIIAGRTTPPTEEELAAHEAAGGVWNYLPPVGGSTCSCAACAAHQQPGGEVAGWNARSLANGGGGGHWWALDAQRRPCAWPLVTEVTP